MRTGRPLAGERRRRDNAGTFTGEAGMQTHFVLLASYDSCINERRYAAAAPH